MYSVVKRILSNALIALIIASTVFRAAAEETQTSPDEASIEAVVTVETPADAAVAPTSKLSFDETASETPQTQEPGAVEP